MKAMLLAAGLGTRLKPFTDHHPKALAMVNGKSLLLRNIEYLRSFGVSELIVNVHHFARQITDYLIEHHHAGVKVFISDETNEVLETGGGLKKASWFFNDAHPFVLMNADMLTDMDLKSMLDYHQRFKPLATLAISKRESSRCFYFNPSMQLCGWGNQSNGEERYSRREDELKPYAFSGIHIIDPAIFPLIKQEGKFSMVDVYLELAKSETILGYDHTGSRLLDVGKPESIIEAEKYFL